MLESPLVDEGAGRGFIGLVESGRMGQFREDEKEGVSASGLK